MTVAFAKIFFLRKKIFFILFFLFVLGTLFAEAKVELGVDSFFSEKHFLSVKDKKIGLITNHTSVNRDLKATRDLFLEKGLSLVALFCPEHGIEGSAYATAKIKEGKWKGIPIFSLHGDTKRPVGNMLKGIDLLVFDIQDIGCRSYTYISTLFYSIEEAAKHNISFIVLDRPNPMGGEIVDGPMLQESLRSFLGYINVPYCYGMTVGELAQFFNEEYKIGCKLKVIPMKGWKREMSFQDTGLFWVPTSPYIPERDTPFFYASTGLLGELELVNIGIGYTLPFKIVGSPWIRAEEFAHHLNLQKIPGVLFLPFHFRPFYGPYKGKDCQGVKILISDSQLFRPVKVQYLLIGMLKTLYPKQVQERLKHLSSLKKKIFCQVSGNEEILECLFKERYVVWKLMQWDEKERKVFLEKRQKYLLY